MNTEKLKAEIERLISMRGLLASEIERLTERLNASYSVENPQWLAHADAQKETETQVIDMEKVETLEKTFSETPNRLDALTSDFQINRKII